MLWGLQHLRPQSPLGGRYPPQVRWPDQLALLQPDRQIVNFGENGREIPRRPWEVQRLEEALKRSSPVDAVVIMLGSNDLLQAVGGPDAISSGRPAPHAPGRLGGG